MDWCVESMCHIISNIETICDISKHILEKHQVIIIKCFIKGFLNFTRIILIIKSD